MAPTRIYVEDTDTSGDTKIHTTRAALPQVLSGLTNGEEHIVVNTAASAPGTPTASAPEPEETTIIDMGNGFSATFFGEVSFVQHVDGPICVVSSSSVTALSAAPETTGTGAAFRNGHVVNPMPSGDGSQSHDGRRPSLGEGAATTFPRVLNPGDVLLLSKSWTGAAFSGTHPQRCGYTEEFAMIYVSAIAPAAGSLSPAGLGWAGRNSFETPSVVNYMERAAALPVAYGVAGQTYPTLEQVRRALRFNPVAAQRDATTDVSGYETFFPTGYSRISPSGSNWNYGQHQASAMELFAASLMAPLSQVPLEVKAEILMRLDSFATQIRQPLQGRNGSISPDGAHRQFHQLPLIIQDWLRGLRPDLTRVVGNWEQAIRITDQDVLDSENGFGDPELLNEAAQFPNRMWFHHWRKVAAVEDAGTLITFETWRNSGSGVGDDQYPGWSPSQIVRQSDGAVATTISDSNGTGGLGGGKQAIARVRLAAAMSPPLAVGDVIRFRAIDDLVAGDPIWRERTARPNSAVPNSGGRYQDLQSWGSIMLVRALGILTDEMLNAWDYFVRSCLTNSPASDDFPAAIGSGAIINGVRTAHLSAITAVPQIYLTVTEEDEYYPDVPPVDMTAAAGSLAFPEGNNGPNAAVHTTEKALYSVPRTGIFALPASTSPQALFAVVRLPKGKRAPEATFGIFGHSGTGGNRLSLRFGADGNGSPGERGKFRGVAQGNTGSLVNIQSQSWTEDAALVVLQCDGANNWQLDWYSLETGARFAGPPSTVSTGTNNLNGGTALAIGGNTTGAGPWTANGGGFQWPGEIEAIGIALAAVTPEQWSAIALGADIVGTIGGANLRFLRDLDGSPASYSRLAGATGDTSSDVYPWGGTEPSVPASKVMRGSHLRRQSAATWLTMKGLTHGWIYGLPVGEVERPVPFSGAAGGLNGQTVEVRIIEAETGVVVKDWTAVSAVSDGVWSGSLVLPKTSEWWVAQARCGGVVCDRRDEFGVGYKIVLLGQSQMRIARQGNPATSGVPLSHPKTMTFVTNFFYSDRSALVFERNMMTVADTTGLRAFVNQWRAFDDTLLMLIDEAVAGTSSQELIDDSLTIRQWSDFQYKLDQAGNDVSCILVNWGTKESETGLNYEIMANRWEAMFYGEGPLVQNHSMAEALAPGWTVGVSPLTRHTTVFSGPANVRLWQVQWANTKGLVVGPPISDMRVNPTDTGHQVADDANGNRLVMARLALAGLKALGVTDYDNPHFTTATRSGAVITVNVALPNGGSLYSPLPSALRSFRVNGSGTGFTAAASGNTVLLTKSSGVWAAGDVVSYESDLASNSSGDATTEAAIVQSALYETFAGDVVCGLGLPVLGSMAANGWEPNWSFIVA